MLKLKVIYSNDIRMFKIKKDSPIDTVLNSLNKFVKVSFKLSNFNIQFKDEENDLVTIVDTSDLKEAIEMNSSITRLYIAKVEDSTVEQEKVIKKDTKTEEKVDDEGEDSEDFDYEKPVCKCGSKLEKVLAKKAYGYTYVICDGCERRVNDNEIVYHCNRMRIPTHKDGYDLCMSCGNKQLNGNNDFIPNSFGMAPMAPKCPFMKRHFNNGFRHPPPPHFMHMMMMMMQFFKWYSQENGKDFKCCFDKCTKTDNKVKAKKCCKKDKKCRKKVMKCKELNNTQSCCHWTKEKIEKRLEKKNKKEEKLNKKNEKLNKKKLKLKRQREELLKKLKLLEEKTNDLNNKIKDEENELNNDLNNIISQNENNNEVDIIIEPQEEVNQVMPQLEINEEMPQLEIPKEIKQPKKEETNEIPFLQDLEDGLKITSQNVTNFFKNLINYDENINNNANIESNQFNVLPVKENKQELPIKENKQEIAIVENNNIPESVVESVPETIPEIDIVDENDNDILEEELYIYINELNQVKEMGFSDETLIKSLLDKYKGNVQNTINQLL